MKNKIKVKVKKKVEKEVSIPEFFVLKNRFSSDHCRFFEKNGEQNVMVISNSSCYPFGLNYLKEKIEDGYEIVKITKEEYIEALSKLEQTINEEIELCNNL